MTIRDALIEYNLLEEEVDTRLVRCYYDGELEGMMGEMIDEATYKDGEMIGCIGDHYSLDMKIDDYDLEYSPLHYKERVLYLYFNG